MQGLTHERNFLLRHEFKVGLKVNAENIRILQRREGDTTASLDRLSMLY